MVIYIMYLLTGEFPYQTVSFPEGMSGLATLHPPKLPKKLRTWTPCAASVTARRSCSLSTCRALVCARGSMVKTYWSNSCRTPPKVWNLKSNSKIAGNSCAILGLLYLMTNSWKVNVNIWWELYSQYTVYSIHIVRSWGSFFNLGHHQWFAQKGVTAESETLSSSLSIFEVLFWGPSGTPAPLNSRGYSTVRIPFTRK
jgi:hypothetical protein